MLFKTIIYTYYTCVIMYTHNSGKELSQKNCKKSLKKISDIFRVIYYANEKKEENYIKKGGKGLKNVSFWVIN